MIKELKCSRCNSTDLEEFKVEETQISWKCRNCLSSGRITNFSDYESEEYQKKIDEIVSKRTQQTPSSVVV